MNAMKFSIEIHAGKKRVWQILWEDETFRQWAGLIDPGTYMKGELREGGEVEFISAENGYGVTSLVEKLIPYEYLLFRHQADTQNSGEQQRDKEWTGGKESYNLIENDGSTTLTATFDVPPELEEYFKDNYPKAFEQVKMLAEGESQ